jgi:hypothetical protein
MELLDPAGCFAIMAAMLNRRRFAKSDPMARNERIRMKKRIELPQKHQ